MRLVTIHLSDSNGGGTHAGVVNGDMVIPLQYPTVLELLRDPVGMEIARQALHTRGRERGTVLALQDVTLLAPLPEPPSLRDFYAFEQHVKTTHTQRGLTMAPEWYKIPTFYFSNTSEIYGPNVTVPYPEGCRALDFELEMACVVGRAGKNIPVEEAEQYIAGYMIMNDWSARDFQRKDMEIGLGPGKGKDFATSLGPWLVTPDELEAHRVRSGDKGRYELTMLARLNGEEISRGNLRDIYYSFAHLISWASNNARLRVGDVLGTGTVGTGCLLEQGSDRKRWLQRNDEVELEIEGLGTLRNRIV